jgi:hypothetical protein
MLVNIHALVIAYSTCDLENENEYHVRDAGACTRSDTSMFKPPINLGLHWWSVPFELDGSGKGLGLWTKKPFVAGLTGCW